MGGKHKQPRTGGGREPSPEKRPRAETDDPTGSRLGPVWRVGRIEIEGPFGWQTHGRTTIADLHKKLSAFETMTWSEIERAGSHNVAVPDLAKAARDRLKELHLDDREELFSLRLTGKSRVWGIRDGRALDVMWWDPEHAVCPSYKKNT